PPHRNMPRKPAARISQIFFDSTMRPPRISASAKGASPAAMMLQRKKASAKGGTEPASPRARIMLEAWAAATRMKPISATAFCPPLACGTAAAFGAGSLPDVVILSMAQAIAVEGRGDNIRHTNVDHGVFYDDAEPNPRMRVLPCTPNACCR